MSESVYSKPHKLRARIIIGMLFSLLIASILSLICGSRSVVVIILGCAIVFLLLLLPPKWSLLITIPIFGVVDDMASQVAQKLDQSIILGGLAAVISTIGMVSFALTYINAARARKLKGILMEDVINAFYPGYKWILVLNGAFACLGRFACEVDIGLCAILCFSGMLCCLSYMLYMANEIAFTEKRARQLTSKYIALISEKFIKKELGSFGNLKLTNFISSIGNYIAQHYNESEFSVSDSSHEDEIKSLLPLIRCDNNHKLQATSYIEQSVLHAFEDGNVSVLNSNDMGKQYCHDCSVVRLPYTDCVRTNIEHEVRIACGLWRSILDKIPNEQARVQAVCQILCIEHCLDTKLSGTLGCGLLMYLHNTYIPDLYPADAKGWETSVRFLYLMYNAANDVTAERNEINLGRYPVDKDWLRKRCVDMIITQMSLALLEQSCSSLKFNEQSVKNTVTAVLWQEAKKEEKRVVDNGWVELYVYQAFILLRLLPIPVLSPKDAKERKAICQKIIDGIHEYCSYE